MISDQQVDKVAAAGLAGMDPTLWIHVDSDIELTYLNRIADRMISLHREQRQEQADRIIGSLDKALKRGKQNKKG